MAFGEGQFLVVGDNSLCVHTKCHWPLPQCYNPKQHLLPNISNCSRELVVVLPLLTTTEPAHSELPSCLTSSTSGRVSNRAVRQGTVPWGPSALVILRQLHFLWLKLLGPHIWRKEGVSNKWKHKPDFVLRIPLCPHSWQLIYDALPGRWRGNQVTTENTFDSQWSYLKCATPKKDLQTEVPWVCCSERIPGMQWS